MNWESFFIGAALSAICFAIINGAMQAYKFDKEKQREQASLKKQVKFDLPMVSSQIQILFERIEKLEKRRR